MIEFVLFDLDGTLTDPFEGITSSVLYALSKYDIHCTQEQLKCFIGPPLENSFIEFFGFTPKRAKEAVVYYRERFSTTGIYENSVYPGIEDMLSSLESKKITSVIATSKPEVFARRILEHFSLTRYFNNVTGSELDGRRTDKTEVISEALRRIGGSDHKAQRCIMVGDRIHDIVGAKKNSLRSVFVKYGYAPPGEAENSRADYIVNDVASLSNLLQSLL